MKRFTVAILIVVLLTGVAVCCLSNLNGSFAYAETNTSYYRLEVGDRKGDKSVILTPITNKGEPVGVHMRENFFGDSAIPVEVNIYSNNNLIIDFQIGAADSTLTDTQRRTKQTLIDLFTDIVSFIDRVDSLANSQSAGLKKGQQPSDVYRYNNASVDDDGTVAVDNGYRIEIAEETYQMLEIAQEMYTVTGGAFNPAVYRLVDLWGFSSRTFRRNGKLPYDRQWVSYNEYPLPDQKYIDAFSDADFVDFSEKSVELTTDNGKYYVTKKVAPITVDGESYQQWIDLGGIAKGYVADVVKAKLYKAGIDRFHVDAGSSSIAFGLYYDGGNNQMALSNGFNNNAELYSETIMELSVGKSSISTSGQNIRRYVVDGVDYSHIVDGQTGSPAQKGIRSVTVVVPAGDEESDFWATRGDCLTTALTVMGYDRIVEFIGDYLEQNGIKVVVQYETLRGSKQLLTTFDKDAISNLSEDYADFTWDERGFYVTVEKQSDYAWVLIVLGCILGAGAIALIVYHFVRGKKRTVSNVQNAKRDKPFKVLDVMVYICVVLVILVLFYVFIFDTDSEPMRIINAVDDQTGETLFTYNFARNQYEIYNNSTGWTVEVNKADDKLTVTFSREIDGEKHFNTIVIDTKATTVKMVDSLCGYHQDCVRSFSAIEHSGGAIVCSPNRLKIVTE